MKQFPTYDIYYDVEGDFLEIAFGISSKKNYVEEPEEGIFIRKDDITGEVIGIGILSFKKRTEVLARFLQEMNISIPINISV